MSIGPGAAAASAGGPAPGRRHRHRPHARAEAAHEVGERRALRPVAPRTPRPWRATATPAPPNAPVAPLTSTVSPAFRPTAEQPAVGHEQLPSPHQRAASAGVDRADRSDVLGRHQHLLGPRAVVVMRCSCSAASARAVKPCRMVSGVPLVARAHRRIAQHPVADREPRGAGPTAQRVRRRPRPAPSAARAGICACRSAPRPLGEHGGGHDSTMTSPVPRTGSGTSRPRAAPRTPSGRQLSWPLSG